MNIELQLVKIEPIPVNQLGIGDWATIVDHPSPCYNGLIVRRIDKNILISLSGVTINADAYWDNINDLTFLVEKIPSNSKIIITV